ncbi:MAG: hypothetical protein ACLGJB_19685 [Blastocatellia bacterium]
MPGQGKMSPSRETIPLQEVSFHPHSFTDPDGRLFLWNGQVYRGISFNQASFFLRLFREGTIQTLVDKGLLIESHLTQLSIEGYAAVVRHKRVPFISYPQEWCAAMLKDAALIMVNLAAELTGRGLTLKDGHPWNLLFDACKPVYVDMTSIAPSNGDGRWPAYEEFCRFCLYPLMLMAHGHDRVARSLLPEFGGVQRRELEPLARGATRPLYGLSRLVANGARRALSLFRRGDGGHTGSSFLNRIREEIEGLSVNSYDTRASGDDGGAVPTAASTDDSVQDLEILQRILAELKPASVLDLSASGGVYSRMAASTCGRVVTFDMDSGSVTRLYNESRDRGWSILPLMVDFMKPTPSVGYSSHHLIAATDRLKCEMVLALTLVRRAVVEQSLTFDLMAEGLALFSTRWVVVELPPRPGPLPGDERGDRLSWYTLDNFTEALKKRFRSVGVMACGPGPRALLLCEK